MKGNTMKKYELIESDKVLPSGRPLFQVVALQDFGFVKKGDKGGYIESEANLSHEGNCWVSGNAQIFGGARVTGDAQVYDDARVYGAALVFDNARVCDDAQVSGTARVFDYSWVSENAQVSGNARVHNNAKIFRDTQITAGHAFAIKDNSWDITEVDNGNGTSTLYANAVFEFACNHVTGGVPDEEGKAMVFRYCPKCGEEL